MAVRFQVATAMMMLALVPSVAGARAPEADQDLVTVEISDAHTLRERMLAGEDPTEIVAAAQDAMAQLTQRSLDEASTRARIELGILLIDAMIRQRNPREALDPAKELEKLTADLADPDLAAMVRDRHVKIQIYAGDEASARRLIDEWRASQADPANAFDVAKGATLSLAQSEITLLAQRGDPAGALPLSESLIRQLEAYIPSATPETQYEAKYALATQYETRGALFLMLGRLEESFPELEKASAGYNALDGIRAATHINLATTRAAALGMAGRTLEAQEVLREILGSRPSDLPPGGIYGLRLRASLFGLELRNGEFVAAEATGEALLEDARILARDALAAGTPVGNEERTILADFHYNAVRLAALCAECAAKDEIAFGAMIQLLQARAAAANLVAAAPADQKQAVHLALNEGAGQLAGLPEEQAIRSLADFQNDLSDDEAVLLVVAGSEESVVQLLRHDRVVTRTMPATQVELCETVSAMRTYLGDIAPLSCLFDVRGRPFRDLSASIEGSPDAARLLHEWIIAPFEADLEGVAMLHVAPLDSAAALPWAALRDADGVYLIERTALDFLPALAVGADAPDMRTAGGYLGVGSPCIGAALRDCGTFVANGDTGAAIMRGSIADNEESDLGQSLFLPALPFSSSEIERTGHLFEGHAKFMIGEGALRPAILENLSAGAPKVVHFATHGLSAGEFGLTEPGLVLSPERGTDGEAVPSLLLASELARMWLPAELVILSACATAREDAEDATGTVSGFSRALMQAGSRNLLASHGTVPDQSMSDLVVDVVGRWKDASGRRALAEAVRAATLQRIAQSRATAGEAWPMVLAIHLQ
jgi:CHAT domain-containing protein